VGRTRSSCDHGDSHSTATRFVEKSDNVRKESFTNNLLEEPQFTRPREYEGKEVPEVLLSGHHQRIELWKKEQRIRELWCKDQIC